ncbi:MAG: hypothetical protein ACLRYY_09510 [Anaerobutyricum soehngenii]
MGSEKRDMPRTVCSFGFVLNMNSLVQENHLRLFCGGGTKTLPRNMKSKFANDDSGKKKKGRLRNC